MPLILPKKKLKPSERIYEAAFSVATFPAMVFSDDERGPGNISAVATGLLAGILSVMVTLPVWLPIAGFGRLVACFEAK